MILKLPIVDRNEPEKKACPNPDHYWDPGPGKKKLCKIDRNDYANALGAPVYECGSGKV